MIWILYINFRCQPPDLVLFPGSTAEVSECARLCHEHSIPIIPYGTGTGMEGGVVPQQVKLSHE